MVSIFGGSHWMKNRKPFDLKRPLLLWNMLLAVFSITGAFRVGTELIHVATTSGLHGCLCYRATDNLTSLWIFAFIMSKYAELFDTLFIVARKKPLMFLHWYHHVTVLLFSWYTLTNGGSSMRILALVNMIIHSVMYSYYAAMAAGFRMPNVIALVITVMQITQMVMGKTMFWVKMHVFYFLSFLKQVSSFFSGSISTKAVE
jgi:elongation of very long chain fatty acids protein 6